MTIVNMTGGKNHERYTEHKVANMQLQINEKLSLLMEK